MVVKKKYSILQGFGSYNPITVEYLQYMNPEAVRKRAAALERWVSEQLSEQRGKPVVINYTNNVIASPDNEKCHSGCDIQILYENYICVKNESGFNTMQRYPLNFKIINYLDAKPVRTDTYDILDYYTSEAPEISRVVYEKYDYTAFASRMTYVVNKVLQRYKCSEGKTCADLNISFINAVKQATADECSAPITYEIRYDWNCHYDFHFSDEVHYVRKDATVVITQIHIDRYINGVLDREDAWLINTRDYNYFSLPVQIEANNINPIQVLSWSQLDTVRNDIQAFLESQVEIPELINIRTFYERGISECATDSIAMIYRYIDFKCATDEGVPDTQYATKIEIAYISEITYYRIYNITEKYPENTPTFVLTEDNLLNMTVDDYRAVVNMVYGYIGNEMINYFFNFETIDAGEGIKSVEPGICSPAIEYIPEYYCHEKSEIIYDSTKIEKNCTIIKSAYGGCAPGGFKLKKDFFEPYDKPTYDTVKNALSGEAYTGVWNPPIQVNGKNHTGQSDGSVQNRWHFPVISFQGLSQTIEGKEILTVYKNLCITESKNYAVCVNADDDYWMYIDNTLVSSKTSGHDASNHWDLFTFDIYIPKGHHLLKFEFRDYGGRAMGAVLEIYDDINVLFAQYEDIATMKATLDQHVVYRVFDDMYDVYNASASSETDKYTGTRAIGLIPFYTLTSEGQSQGWEIAADDDCNITGAKKKVWGTDGFRIAKHVIKKENDENYIAINSSKYVGYSIGQSVVPTGTGVSCEIIDIFDEPADLETKSQFYKDNPVYWNGIPIVEYNDTAAGCHDLAETQVFKFNQSGFPPDYVIPVYLEFISESVAVWYSDAAESIGVTNLIRLGYYYEGGFTDSGVSRINPVLPDWLEYMNNNHLIKVKDYNAGQEERIACLEFRSTNTDIVLYLYVVQKVFAANSNVVYNIESDGKDTVEIICCKDTVTINIDTSKDGNYIPTSLQVDPLSDVYLSHTKVRNLNVPHGETYIIQLNQNRTAAARNLLLHFVQDESGLSTDVAIIQHDCRQLSFASSAIAAPGTGVTVVSGNYCFPDNGMSQHNVLILNIIDYSIVNGIIDKKTSIPISFTSGSNYFQVDQAWVGDSVEITIYPAIDNEGTVNDLTSGLTFVLFDKTYNFNLRILRKNE
jgi:hypothetical protein